MNTVKNDSKLLYLQAKYQFEQAMEKFENGSIKGEPQLIQAVFQSFHDFFTTMGKPHMIPRYAEENGPPWSEDYNAMMDEIKADLETLFEEIDILGRSLYTDFNHNVMQVDIIEKEYEKVHDKLKDLEMYAGYSNQGMIRFGRDDFFNGLKIDYDRIAGTPLEITKTGVSLPLSNEARNVAENAQVTIVPGNQKHNDYILGSDSNGFPGNNNEVTMISNDLLTGTSGFQFVGKDDNHGNYGSIIDGNPNTWFEYERINLRDHERRKIAKQLGWDYVVNGNKTLRFAEDPEDGVLKLHLQIVLDQEEVINQINVNMYTPPNYGSHTAVVKNILVSSEFGAPVSVVPENKEPTDYNFRFDPIKAKVISILFEQEYKYFTDIGHVYYEKKMDIAHQRDYVFETLQHKEKMEYAPRIDGPKINIESLGAHVDVHETNIQAYYPLKGAEAQGYSMEDITNDLFMQVDESTVEAGIERFEGWRYCIGIRDIEVLSAEYLPKGELVTKPYYFDQPVERIAISASETIGDLLAKNSEMKYEWITYYVSIDDGKEWYSITPIEHEMRASDPPKLYTIQYVASENEIIDSQPGYIETTNPVYSLRLRIVIERPEDEAAPFQFMNTVEADSIPSHFHSSSVQSFQMQVETKRAEEDSIASIFTVDYKDSGYQPLPPKPPTNEIPDLPPDDGDKPNPSLPPGGGWDPSENHEDIMITMNVIPDKWCEDKNLVISGSVTSSLPIERLELYINDTYIDTGLSGAKLQMLRFETTKDNACIECGGPSNASLQSMQLMANSDTQKSFNWSIPYSKAEELGLQVGDMVTVRIIAEDSRSRDTETFSFMIEKCEEMADCYELESVIVHYYNEAFNEIREIELAKEILPYEFDNGEGVMVTVGWNNSLKAPTIMHTGGYHEGQNAFVIHAVGIRYQDFDYVSKVQWGISIAESSNALNTHLMVGEPSDRSDSWVSQIEAGNYEYAPSLDRINSWVTISMGNEWIDNHCPIKMNFAPEDHLAPETPAPSGEEEYECIEVRKIFIQYYDVDNKALKIKTVDLDEAYRGVYQFTIEGRTVDALIGWFDYYDGISISINSTNNQRLYITAGGILIRDKTGVVRTEWANQVVIESNHVENSNRMIGNKKQAESLSWLDQGGNPNNETAPQIYRHQDAVILGFDSSIIDELCVIDNVIDDRKDAPKFDRTPPEIIMDDIPDPFYYQDLINETFPLQALVRDNEFLIHWSVSAAKGNWEENFTKVTLQDNIDIQVPLDIPDPIEYEETSNEVDIIFVIDTSGSMANRIQSVKDNLITFTSYLQEEDLDINLGYLGSRFNNTKPQHRSDMTPVDEFSLDPVDLNGGSWENLAWRQITDTTYGAASLYSQLRPEAKHHIVFLTDTYITADLDQSIIDDLIEDNKVVSVIWRKGVTDEPNYERLTNATGGVSLNVDNPDFHEEMKILSEGIISKFSYIPDSSHVIRIKAEDEAGNITTKEIVLNLTDRHREED